MLLTIIVAKLSMRDVCRDPSYASTFVIVNFEHIELILHYCTKLYKFSRNRDSFYHKHIWDCFAV